ncbi:SufE family protein [Rhizosphaericola mali]|uniref:SufE family protein n=1 Tax=Rhizosphaericola mali TaxID=2545455 RepID=A0A5P2G031_9BACT|nr:SufE family protein [Rhizosphaericola mali]QES88008.1 SufE family protein [Rhizosphaericola mali]
MTIEEQQQEIIEDFEFLTDWMDKYEMIIQLGKELPLIDEKYKTEDYKIKGCQSQVWVHADYNNGVIDFTADSDAIITKGLISMIIKVYSGHTPAEILDNNLHFIDEIGLHSHLSPTRSNGLSSMVKQIKEYAFALQKLEQK